MSSRSRAIVTGGAGFIGSHLVERLGAEGQSVLVVDDLSTGTIDHLAPSTALERLDVSTDDLDLLFRQWRPTVVYHLAAQASVPRSIAEPLRDLAINVVGTSRVVTATRRARARRFVFVSSGGAVYGETRRAATERAKTAPMSYYGAHKLVAESHVALAGVSHAIARPSNVYGPRQAAGLEGAVVAAFLDQATTTSTLRIHGDGRQTRDLIHVRDVVEALLILGRADADGLWNVASGHSATILDLADVIEAAVGRPLVRVMGPRRPGDVTHSAMSAGRLRSFGWRPATRLREGIDEIIRERTVRPGNSV